MFFPYYVKPEVFWAKGEENLDMGDVAPSLQEEDSSLGKIDKKNLVGKEGNDLTISNGEEGVLNYERNEGEKTLVIPWRSYFSAIVIVVVSLTGLLFISSILRKSCFRSSSGLMEVLDVLRLDSRHEIISLRWGQKIVLVAKSGDGWILLSELSDEEDVRRYLEKHEFLKLQGSQRNIDLSKHILCFIREKFNR